MKRYVVLIEDENENRNFWPYDADSANDCEDMALAEHGENARIVTIYCEI